MSLEQFLTRLKKAAELLTPESIEQELRDTLSPVELAGLDRRMKVGLMRLIEKIEVGKEGQ